MTDNFVRNVKNFLFPVPTGLKQVNRSRVIGGGGLTNSNTNFSSSSNTQQSTTTTKTTDNKSTTTVNAENHKQNGHHQHSPFQLQHRDQQQMHDFTTVMEAYVSFVLTVPGAFGAVWAIFASTDAVLGLFSDNKYRILTHKPVMLLAVFVASMTAIMACLKHVRSLRSSKSLTSQQLQFHQYQHHSQGQHHHHGLDMPSHDLDELRSVDSGIADQVHLMVGHQREHGLAHHRDDVPQALVVV
eukprot:c12833_g2_i3.p1 GENE.c12833_g2_i3~~c12833_g2_i3.p1  ORF type:complete len:242 (+),score=60.34 c12833_g2_i3:434-1159(+)